MYIPEFKNNFQVLYVEKNISALIGISDSLKLDIKSSRLEHL